MTDENDCVAVTLIATVFSLGNGVSPCLLLCLRFLHPFLIALYLVCLCDCPPVDVLCGSGLVQDHVSYNVMLMSGADPDAVMFLLRCVLCWWWMFERQVLAS